MTGNLGVSALCYATMRAICGNVPSLHLAVLDDGWGHRSATLMLDGRRVSYSLIGERLSRRYWRSESLWNIGFSCRLGGLRNPTARALRAADAVMDISGGDSFTDLYGPHRFRAVTLFKRIVLKNRIPLILLPQTYGPFASEKNRRVAESIVRSADMAWARDARSFEQLKKLAGNEFDPQRYRCGVDVAFGLEAMSPANPLPAQLTEWLEDRRVPMVGINVSGLIHNDPGAAARQYGLKADYRQVVRAFVSRLLKDSDCRILFIPHVVTAPGHHESDLDACDQVAKECNDAGRVQVLPALADPREAKWVISKMNWFCGTRMHATIAALSSGVPTAAIAYSLKTLGVFESCKQGDQVADPRLLNTEQMVEHLWESWRRREACAKQLQASLPAVLEQSRSQINEMLVSVEGFRNMRKTAV